MDSVLAARCNWLSARRVQSQQLFVEAVRATEKSLEAMLAVQRVHGNNEVQQGTLRLLRGWGWELGL